MNDVTKPPPHAAFPTTIVIAAKVSELPKVVEPLRKELATHGCPRTTLDQVVVAVEELFVNIASYAYSTDQGPVRVTYTFEEPTADGSAGVTIAIEDKGIPFDPVSRPDPVLPTNIEEVKIGGLGIFMAKKSVDRMTYERRQATNVVTLSKRWKTAANMSAEP